MACQREGNAIRYDNAKLVAASEDRTDNKLELLKRELLGQMKI